MRVGRMDIGNKVVTVVWRDAASKDDWHSTSDPEGASGSVVCTTGYLISESPADIVISHTLAPSGKNEWDTCCAIAIPKSCILEAYESAEYASTLRKRHRNVNKKKRARR